MRPAPPLSIGLPVRNAARFLDLTLDSLRRQEFGDFEVLIADNASTDDTPAIARATADADRRFRYVRHERNIGADRNWNYVFGNTKGPLFAWIGGDDACAPSFYRRCVELLAEQPGAVAAFTGVNKIDEHGQVLGEIPEPARWDHPDPAVRFGDYASFRHRCQMCYAVVRRDVLARTDLLTVFPGADRLLIAQLALLGPFARDPARLFSNREHRNRGAFRTYTQFYADSGLPLRKAVLVHHLRELWATPIRLGADPDLVRRARLRLLGWTAANSVALARSIGGAARDTVRERLSVSQTSMGV